MSSSSTSSPSANITGINETDYDEWARLFKAYVAYCQSTISEDQSRKTFSRVVDPESDLYGLGLRDGKDGRKLYGIALFFPHQTTMTEKLVMHLNGNRISTAHLRASRSGWCCERVCMTDSRSPSDLYIDPHVRGRGYGRKLIEAVAEKAKSMGCVSLRWAAYHDNEVGRKLYDRMATCDFVEYRMKLGDF